MYFAQYRGAYDEGKSRALMIDVSALGGFVLMATKGGLIVAVDDADIPKVQNHAFVELAHPVTLNPRGLAAARLQQIFSENIQRQLSAVAPSPGTEDPKP
jgi:hypothetical protein